MRVFVFAGVCPAMRTCRQLPVPSDCVSAIRQAPLECSSLFKRSGCHFPPLLHRSLHSLFTGSGRRQPGMPSPSQLPDHPGLSPPSLLGRTRSCASPTGFCVRLCRGEQTPYSAFSDVSASSCAGTEHTQVPGSGTCPHARTVPPSRIL